MLRVIVTEASIDEEGFSINREVQLETDVGYSPDVAQDLVTRAVAGWAAQHDHIFLVDGDDE